MVGRFYGKPVKTFVPFLSGSKYTKVPCTAGVGLWKGKYYNCQAAWNFCIAISEQIGAWLPEIKNGVLY